MKYTGSIHTTFYALLAAAALTAAGCSDDDNEKGGGATGVEANFSAEITPYTRAAGDTWANGDAVGIYMLGGDAGTADNVRYTCEPNGRLSAADAKIVIPGSGTFDFVAYHPYKQSSLSGDAGKIDGYLYPVVLSDQTDPAAIDLLWSDNATGVTAAAPDVKFTFEHVLSKVEIAVKQGGGISADDLAGVVVTIDGVYNEGFFALNSGRIGNTGVPGAVTARAVTEGVSYEAIVLPTTGAAQQGRVFTVEAPLLGRTYTWTMPDDYLFVGGKIHEIEITVDVDGISVVTGDIADWNGGDSNPEVETDDAEFLALPNSYIARPGSTVTIPVAKAYAAWHNIPMLQEGSFSIPNDLTARIVWQERFDEDETILFSTNDKVTMTGSGINAAIEVVLTPDVEGSLVVGVYDGDGNCYWSWHIWATEYDPSQPAGQQTVGGNVFMDRNLGATSLVKGPQSAGCFYQWGRKDPFQGPYTWMMFLNANAGWSNDGIGKFMTLKGLASTKVPSENLVASVQQPYRYIVGISGTQDWLSPDVGGEAYRWSNADGTKGVFDPCPEGWRVPVSGAGAASAWADLNGVWDAERTGCVFAEGNGYYPAAGYINIMSASGSGGGAEAGTSGYCWSASSAGRNGYALTYSVSAIKTEAELTKAWACPVRCVKDVK